MIPYKMGKLVLMPSNDVMREFLLEILFLPPEDFNIALLTLDLEFVKKGNKEEMVDAVLLTQQIKKRFVNQVMTSGQRVTFEYHGNGCCGRADKSDPERGMLSSDSYIVFEASNSSGIKVLFFETSDLIKTLLVLLTLLLFLNLCIFSSISMQIVNQREAASSNIFRHKEFNLQSLGIGGLGNEFADIFRRAFASRVFPHTLGVKHVKGMVLYGPPGTGKTLMARQIGKMLNGKDPKINTMSLSSLIIIDQRRSYMIGKECFQDFSTSILRQRGLNGIVDCGQRHDHIFKRTMLLAEQVKVSRGSPLITVLLEGPSGSCLPSSLTNFNGFVSGKTAMAATVGIGSDFPYVKICANCKINILPVKLIITFQMISAESMIGISEASKCAQIVKVFEDAYKSTLSIIILDDIERLLEYVAIGPRFSNLISQTLMVLLKRLPPKGKNMLVIGTTSEVSFLESVGICDAFSVTYHVPTLKTEDAKTVLQQLNVFSEDDVDAAAEALNDMFVNVFGVVDAAEEGLYGGRDGGTGRVWWKRGGNLFWQRNHSNVTFLRMPQGYRPLLVTLPSIH
ncbi:LOW QUALITY PROTEIN: hypothetical protein OSB04_000541, partial [Centaurea solstitialis]